MAEKITKQYIKGYVQKAEDGRLQVSIASSGNVDRDGDTINPNGWVLENFLKNNVMLWGHNSFSPAIGNIEEVKIEGGKMTFVPVFDMDDEFAALLFNKYKKGVLNTFSVGFDPIEWTITDTGYSFEKQELLEISAVNIPANPDARVLREMADVYAMAQSKGYKLDEEAEKIINKFYRKGMSRKDDDSGLAELTEKVDNLTKLLISNNSPAVPSSNAEGNRASINSDKQSGFNAMSPQDLFLRDSLVLLDKAIEITLKRQKSRR